MIKGVGKPTPQNIDNHKVQQSWNFATAPSACLLIVITNEKQCDTQIYFPE